MNSGRTTITRVALRNYKSIAACDVKLAPLTVLVGPNGSGKGNFLDALRFVAESLRLSLDHALRDRDGIQNVRRRSGGHPKDLQIRLDFRLPEVTGWFAFRIRALPDRDHVLEREECHVFPVDDRLDRQHYRVEAGSVVESSLRHPPVSSGDRLYLVAVSGMKGFRPVYDALEGMAFHNLNPDRMMEMQPPDPGGRLARDGGNLASVLARLNAVSPERTEQLIRYLGRIVPGVIGVESRMFGDRLALEFRQRVCGAAHPRRFRGNDLSDGTLRALGVLVALFQTGATGFPRSAGRGRRGAGERAPPGRLRGSGGRVARRLRVGAGVGHEPQHGAAGRRTTGRFVPRRERGGQRDPHRSRGRGRPVRASRTTLQRWRTAAPRSAPPRAGNRDARPAAESIPVRTPGLIPSAATRNERRPVGKGARRRCYAADVTDQNTTRR